MVSVNVGGQRPPRDGRTRYGRTSAARLGSVTLVAIVLAAAAAVLLAAVPVQAQYVVLIPLSTGRARAVLVTAAPLMLGLACFLLSRSRRAAVVSVIVTLLLEVPAAVAGYLLFGMSVITDPVAVAGPDVVAVSPARRFELVRTAHQGFAGAGPYELVWLRSRAGLASRESTTPVLRCDTNPFEYLNPVTRHTGDELTFIDDTAVGIRVGRATIVVAFDPDTLLAERTVKLDNCPHHESTRVPSR